MSKKKKQIILFSRQKETDLIVKELEKQIGHNEPKLILLFNSTIVNGMELHKKIKNLYPKVVIIGSTSYGEIANGEMYKETVTGIALTEEVIGKIKLEVVENVKENIENIEKAFTSFGSHFGENTQNMDYKKYVGMVITDFASQSEEKVMDKIGDLTNVIFVGGSSADNWEFSKTEVFAEGKGYKNAVVLLLMKPNTDFDFIKTQSFKPLDKKFIATKVDPETRSILELDGKPAGEVYAEALGIDIKEVPNYFSSNPLGVVVGEEIYVRSPIDIQKGRVTFVSNTLEGVEVTLLQATDIIQDTKQAVNKKVEKMGGEISALINFHCTLRTKELEAKNITKEYGELFRNLPAIGFSTFGEAYLGHVNQTSTMIVFK